MFSLGSLGYMEGVMVVDGFPWNPGDMVPGRPDMPAVPDPDPQSCGTDGSQSQEWGHQGCLGHFQEGQKGHYQVQQAKEGHSEAFPQLQCCGPSSGEIC